MSTDSWFDCICCEQSKSKSEAIQTKESQKELRNALLNYKESKKKQILNAKKWSKDTSIVIIGGGHSGIHMASLLVESGYKNVVILERNYRYGGVVFR